jgi:hypothetical protein
LILTPPSLISSFRPRQKPAKQPTAEQHFREPLHQRYPSHLCVERLARVTSAKASRSSGPMIGALTGQPFLLMRQQINQAG